jgi:phosphate transport system permease protein
MSDYFKADLPTRHRIGKVWQVLFRASTTVGILVLFILLLTIINNAFGYVAYEFRVDPVTLARNGVALDELSKDELVLVLQENVSKGLFRNLEHQVPFEQRTRDDVLALIDERVIGSDIVQVWSLLDSLKINKDQALAYIIESHPNARIELMSWLDLQFLTSPQSSTVIRAGIRTAILGSLMTILVAILFAFPIGIGAAIYLEEYAADNRLNRIIRTNIYNLSGVPSIIYGMLGLAIFVRTLNLLTSGAIFGVVDPVNSNGRTILSAGLTLGILILPMIIINAQEAIKAVPNSLRLASFGLGGTRWQTVWHHVLPSAIPGILTGTILAISRAFGETAPLVVVGASTFISNDPTSIFSKFTTLPIQIYQWTSRPQEEFRSIAAAAILVLLFLLLSLNTTAILLRNRYSRRLN